MGFVAALLIIVVVLTPKTLNIDKIIYVENGKIIEMGTHEELLNKNGSYRILHDLQFRLDKHRIKN